MSRARVFWWTAFLVTVAMLSVQRNQPVEFHSPFLVGLVIVMVVSMVAALALGRPAKPVTTTTKKTAFRSNTTVSNDAVKLRTFLTYHRGTAYRYIDLESVPGLQGINLQRAVKDLEGQLIITEQSGVAMYSMR